MAQGAPTEPKWQRGRTFYTRAHYLQLTYHPLAQVLTFTLVTLLGMIGACGRSVLRVVRVVGLHLTCQILGIAVHIELAFIHK